MAKYFWFKLVDSFFSETYVKALRALPKGDSMVTAYLEMALHSLKTEGVIRFKGFMPTVADELAVAVSEPAPLIKRTLDMLVKFGVVVIDEENNAVFTEVVNNICSETSSAQRMRDFRKRKALQNTPDIAEQPSHCDNTVAKVPSQRCTEIEIEKEKEIKTEINPEKEIKPQPDSPAACDISGTAERFNEICPDLPKVQQITGQRETALLSAIKQLNGKDITELFKKTAASDFLCGRKSGGWKASFDWILKPENLAKIMDGNYDNKASPQAPQTDYTCGGKYVNALELTGDIDPEDYPF